MNYKILLYVVLVVILVGLGAAFVLPGLRPQPVAQTPAPVRTNVLPQVVLSTSTPQSFTSAPGDAFSSEPPSQPQPEQTSTQVPSSQVPVYQGKPVASLDDVARIIASAPAPTTAPKPTSTTATTTKIAAKSLALPAVSDSDLTISQSGVATAFDYMKYFSVNFQKVTFDSKHFDGVLKDKSGNILFVNDLIQKALIDNNFGEIHASLVVQRDLANADISFMKTIKVTGAAVALNKQAIGFEELTIALINNALGVEDGTVSKNNFLTYYAQFFNTAAAAHQQLVAQSNVVPMATGRAGGGNWLTKVLGWFGVKAFAQSVVPPFGGQVVTIIPCPCDLGSWVTISTPVPASLFVPWVFMASPLFYPFKGVHPGAWWLGLYNPLVQIPCLVPPLCTPIGAGGDIIMAGTSA